LSSLRCPPLHGFGERRCRRNATTEQRNELTQLV
jgi:hypothetical protein